MTDNTRILILGNAGSGKTTMARRLSQQHGIPWLSMDDVAWAQAMVRKPVADSVRELLAYHQQHSSWIIEGCYGDLVEPLLPHCTELRWIDPGVEACVANCKGRPHEPEKFASKQEQDAMLQSLITWVKEYDTRDDEFGRARHERLFNAFQGRKRRYTTNLTLRLATPTDVPAIVEIFNQSRATAMPWLPKLHTHDQDIAWAQEKLLTKHDVTLAIAGGKPVAFAGYIPGWLNHLYVSPASQAQGAGARLFHHVTQALPEGFRFYVFQRNEAARRFYEARGCTLLSTGDGSGNEENEPDALYQWRPTANRTIAKSTSDRTIMP